MSDWSNQWSNQNWNDTNGNQWNQNNQWNQQTQNQNGQMAQNQNHSNLNHGNHGNPNLNPNLNQHNQNLNQLHNSQQMGQNQNQNGDPNSNSGYMVQPNQSYQSYHTNNTNTNMGPGHGQLQSNLSHGNQAGSYGQPNNSYGTTNHGQLNGNGNQQQQLSQQQQGTTINQNQIPRPDPTTRYTGYLKYLHSNCQFGFIHCEDLEKTMGGNQNQQNQGTDLAKKCDVFLSRPFLTSEQSTGLIDNSGNSNSGNMSQARPELGQWVQFNIELDSRGRFQGKNVTWLHGRVDPSELEKHRTNPQNSSGIGNGLVTNGQNTGGVPGAAPNGTYKLTESFEWGNPNTMSSQNQQQNQHIVSNQNMNQNQQNLNQNHNLNESVLSNPAKLYQGNLKSFSEMKGYGFISCQEVANMHQGRDVYIHKSEINKNSSTNQYIYRVGQSCEFGCVLNEKKQPQARNVKWLD